MTVATDRRVDQIRRRYVTTKLGIPTDTNVPHMRATWYTSRAGNRVPAIVCEYHHPDGTPVLSAKGHPAVRVRTMGKNGGRWWAITADDQVITVGTDDRITATGLLFGIERLTTQTDRVWIVEGESDCHALWAADIPAVGVPGAGTWDANGDHVKHLAAMAREVVLWVEPGGERKVMPDGRWRITGGEMLLDAVTATRALSGRLSAHAATDEEGDPAAILIAQGGHLGRLAEHMDGIALAAAWVTAPEPPATPAAVAAAITKRIVGPKVKWPTTAISDEIARDMGVGYDGRWLSYRNNQWSEITMDAVANAGAKRLDTWRTIEDVAGNPTPPAGEDSAIKQVVNRAQALGRMRLPGYEHVPITRRWAPYHQRTGADMSGQIRWQDGIMRIGDDGAVRMVPAGEHHVDTTPPLPWAWAGGRADPTPMWDAFLAAAMTDPETVEWLAAWIGRTIMRDIDTHGMGVLLGPGGGGKGTVLRIISRLVGDGQAMAADGPDAMVGRFWPASALGHSVLVMPDMPVGRISPEGVSRLKTLVAGEPLPMERKFVHGIGTARLPMTVWAASNHVPQWARDAGDAEAWARRMNVWQLRKTYDTPDPGLADRIVAGEGAAIARMCVRTWIMVLRGLVTEPRGIGEERSRVVFESLPVWDQWALGLRVDPQLFTTTTDLAAEWEAWWESHHATGSNQTPPSWRSVAEAIKRRGAARLRRTMPDGARSWGYTVMVVGD